MTAKYFPGQIVIIITRSGPMDLNSIMLSMDYKLTVYYLVADYHHQMLFVYFLFIRSLRECPWLHMFPSSWSSLIPIVHLGPALFTSLPVEYNIKYRIVNTKTCRCFWLTCGAFDSILLMKNKRHFAMLSSCLLIFMIHCMHASDIIATFRSCPARHHLLSCIQSVNKNV